MSNISQFYREKVKVNKEPVRFQIISWNKFDKEINDDDPSNDMQQLQKIQTGRIVPDQVALDQWELHNQDPKFLEMWDKKYERPN